MDFSSPGVEAGTEIWAQLYWITLGSFSQTTAVHEVYATVKRTSLVARVSVVGTKSVVHAILENLVPRER